MTFDWLTTYPELETKIAVGKEYVFMTEVDTNIANRLSEGWELVNITAIRRKVWYGEKEVLFSVFKTKAEGYEEVNELEKMEMDVNWAKQKL